MDVIAVITAQGETRMNERPEHPITPEASASDVEQPPTQPRRAAAQTRHVARGKRKSAKKAAASNKARVRPTSTKSAKNPKDTRKGSKTAKVVELLKRPAGATGTDLMKATGWQAHSVRGFLSGVLARKMGLKIKSAAENGERRYKLQR
jgi:Protein of unknown function (DUF3489)